MRNFAINVEIHSKMSTKNLIYIAGPTAVGKSKLSLGLAKMFNSEILSCDSRQFYKELSIGTAAPTAEELAEVPHHFVQHKSIHDTYTVGDFEEDAIERLNTLYEKMDTVIMVGGSGMYADSVMFGLDKFPKVSDEIRNQLNVFHKTHGIQSVQQLLLEKDPKYYRIVDRNNPLRLIRALEVCIASGKPYSSFLGKEREPRPFVSKMLVLHCPRPILYERINSRVDKMIENGLENEVEGLIEKKQLSALKSVGYKELFEYFDGKCSKEEAIAEIKKNTRRYAKRQITWFKKYDDAFCFPANTPVDQVYDLLIS